MSNLIFKYSRITFSIFTTLIFLGLVSWFTMPREEDPRLKKRFGNIQVIYPGASAEEVHRLIVKPLHDELSQLDQLKFVDGLARSEFAILTIELKARANTEVKIDKAWDEVENKMFLASNEFPSGARQPILDRNAGKQDAIVLSITGGSYSEQIATMQNLESEILATPLVASVNRFADPGETIRINIDEDQLKIKGIALFDVLDQLRSSNQNTPSGSIQYSNKKVSVQSNASFKSIEDIENISLVLNNGQTVALKDIAEVKKSIELPKNQSFRWSKKEGVGLGIVAQENINLIHLGKNVRKTLENFDYDKETLSIDEVSFQPDNVEFRINDLSQSLTVAIFIIALVLVVLIGFRIGIISAVLVPIISLVSLSIYAFMGGVIHQISIAAFVVSLGLLIDNIVVVLEAIQTALDQGLSRLDSAKQAVKKLFLPLTAATGTTIASFIPMLGSSGATADFTRAIPLVIVVSLICSYFFAMSVTPVLGSWFLSKGTSKSWSFLNNIFYRVGQFVFKKSLFIIIVVFALTVVSLSLFPKVKFSFFPSADRNQLVVDIKLPEGTHFKSSDALAKDIETYLLNKDTVTHVASYVGRSTPRFFYNLNTALQSPHIAQMIVIFNNSTQAKNSKLILQKELDQNFPQALIIVRSLAQGPPTKAEVELRVTAKNLTELNSIGESLVSLARKTPGTFKVRSTIGTGSPVLKMNINDANAANYGLTRSRIASSIFARTKGINIGSFRYGYESYPIVIGNVLNENHTLEELNTINVRPLQNQNLSLDMLSFSTLQWQPSVIESRDGLLITRIFSELEQGYNANEVANQIMKNIQEDPSLSKKNIVLDGVAASSSEANNAILKVIPLGILLLLISLLVQFNSFTKVAIIFGSIIPIWIGIVPGLILSNQAFGFVPLLGVLALIGIVANNGILIFDQIDASLENNKTLLQAIEEAIALRARPIILTTITTVLGLLPLVFTQATLWPPFAWTMIFGLLASMMITPIFVPSLYLLLLKKRNKNPGALACVLALIIAAFPNVSEAKTVSLKDFKEHIERHSVLKSAYFDKQERLIEEKRIKNTAYLPSIEAKLRATQRDRELEFETPIGNFGGAGTQQIRVEASFRQPLYKSGVLSGEAKVLAYEAIVKQLGINRSKEILLDEAIQSYVQLATALGKRQSLLERLQTLKKQQSEVIRLLNLGRVSQVDLLRIKLSVSQAKTGLISLNNSIDSLKYALSLALDLNDPVSMNIGDKQLLINDWLPQIKNLEIAVSHSNQLERSDISQINAQMQSIHFRKKGISQSYLPNLDLIGQAYWEDPSAFANQFSALIGFELSWGIFNSGQRNKEKQKLEAIKMSLKHQKSRAEKAEDAQVQTAKLKLKSFIQEWERHKLDYKLAKQVLDQEKQRYFNGKASLNDFLEAQSLFDQKNEVYLTHPYKILSAWSSLALADKNITADDLNF